MKRIFILLCIALTFNSCNNDDDNTSGNRSELIVGIWKLVKINGNDPFANSLEPMVITYEFKSNGDFNYYINSIIDEQSTWNLNTNNTTITFMNDTFNIILLNSTDLKLLLPSSNPNMSIEYGLKKLQ